MDLGLSLGNSARQFCAMPKAAHKSLDFNIRLPVAHEVQEGGGDKEEDERRRSLELFPLLPVSSTRVYSTPTDQNGNSEGEIASTRALDVNKAPYAGDGEEEAAISSPNSTVSSFHMDFNMYGGNRGEPMESMHNDGEAERASSRASDEDENGLTRKKLRLSKDQSAFLEESFKEHNTLNPKQKLALAKQLNLSARQVEVWFQNRRARTKLKQTEVDCEYLKKCCETLTEENRRLQKELQELRALKTSHPFYMQLPATTLTMCPSCERIASTADNNNNNNNNANANNHKTPTPAGSLSGGFSLLGNNKPRV